MTILIELPRQGIKLLKEHLLSTVQMIFIYSQQNLLKHNSFGMSINYLKVEGSTFTPGPIVVVTETFFM